MSQIYKWILFIIAVLINLLFLIFYNKENKDFHNNLGDATIPIYIFSIFNIIFSFICLVVWCLLKAKTKFKIKLEEYRFEK